MRLPPKFLGAVHVKATVVLPELERLLKDLELFARGLAVDALDEYGTDAKSECPLVEHVKQSKGATEKETAIKALNKIDPEAAVQFAIPNCQ